MVSITSDVSEIAELPPEVESAIGASQIFLAGALQFADTRFSFLVTERAGNPILLCFRPSAKSSSIHPIAIHFSLIPAMEARNDLLFLGGETETQPFYAYERAEEQVSSPLSPATQALILQALNNSYSPQLDEALRRLPGQSDWQAAVDFLLEALRNDPNGINNNRLIVLQAIVAKISMSCVSTSPPCSRSWPASAGRTSSKTVDLLEALAPRPELFDGVKGPLVRAFIPLVTSQRGLVVNPALNLLHKLTGEADFTRPPSMVALVHG